MKLGELEEALRDVKDENMLVMFQREDGLPYSIKAVVIEYESNTIWLEGEEI